MNATGQGSNVVLVWDTPGNRLDWTPATVGQIVEMEAQSVAAVNAEFSDLASLGETQVQCLFLNSEFGPLMSYLNVRAESLGVVAIENMKARYAVGVGVEMLVLDEECKKLKKRDAVAIPDAFLEAAYRSAARGTLAVLPEFDQLAKMIESDD